MKLQLASKLIICISLCFSVIVTAGNVLTERNANFSMEYSDDGIISFRQINPSATARDLAAFFEDIYQKKLSRKIQSGLPLSKADIVLLKEVIIGEAQAIGAFGQAFMKDIMDKYPAMSAKKMQAKIKETEGRVPDDWNVFIHNLVEFRDEKQDPLLRNLIKEYATYFKPIDDQSIQDDIICIVKQIYQPFQNPNVSAAIQGLNPFLSIEKSIQKYEDPYLRPYKAIYPDIRDFAMNAEQIGEKWFQMYSIVSHYIKLLRRIYREISGYNSVAKDQYSRRIFEDFMIEQKKELAEMLKSTNMSLVDLPFVFLTKYAYINIQRCKSPLWDDDDRMIAIASV